MTCIHEKLITSTKESRLSVKQYTSVYSVEVVLYGLFNVGLKRHKHPKAADEANDAEGTPGSLKLMWNRFHSPPYFTIYLLFPVNQKFSQLCYTLPHFLIKDLNEVQGIFNDLEIFLYLSSALCLLITSFVELFGAFMFMV